jgi:hypothetical protein
LDLDYEIALNAFAYASLAIGLVQWRRQRLPPPADSVAAFGLLEVNLKRAYPDISEGFTWREAISRARNLKADIEWDNIEKDVEVYEAYRYGDGPAPPPPGNEFLRLLKALRRVH